jgi:hypothetical protein
MPLLLSGLAGPIKTQFSIAVHQGGTVQYSHASFQESQSARFINVRHEVALPTSVGIRLGIALPTRVNRLSAAAQSEAASKRQAAYRAEVQADLENQRRDDANDRILSVLERVADVQLSRDATAWWNWWQNYNEYYWPKPSYYAYDYQPTHYVATYRATSCFLAGTPVRTETGTVKIESIQPGDRVLAQDQDAGELAYKVVLTTTLRPPAEMLTITAGGEEIVTTQGHPFWVSGHGWKMAKQLQEGDLLHSLGGAVKVEKIAPAGKERAHNLVVDDFNTYFVGQAGLLVHDNEFRKPTRAIVPGLVVEEQRQAAN